MARARVCVSNFQLADTVVGFSKARKPLFAIPKSFDDHPELIEMQFRSELSLDIGCADGIYEGHTIPDVKDGEAVNGKLERGS